MNKFMRVEVRMTREKCATVKAHGESVNGFITRAIDETIERDSGKE